MPGLTDLAALLTALDPALDDEAFVFVTRPGDDFAAADRLGAVAAVREAEGLSLVVPHARAEAEGLPFDGPFRRITLRVTSSLHAVGLTAAVAGRLAEAGIPANMVAGYHHDHLFVPADRADVALARLTSLGRAAEHG